MQTTIYQRINEVIRYYHNGKQIGLSKATGIPTSKISSWETSKFLPKFDSLNLIIVNHPTLNAHWLMTGEGEMILTSQNKTLEELKQEIDKLKSEIYELKKDKETYRVIAESNISYGRDRKV